MESTSRFSPRHPVVAGMFYPAQKEKLRSDIEEMFSGTESNPIDGEIYGLVVPHAGYVYSGYVAAEAFHQLAHRQFETVAVIAPSHRDYFRGVSVYAGDYVTPLGDVRVDRLRAEKLMKSGTLIKATELGHREEHALEVQLPFLQSILDDFKILPLVMGTQDWESCYELGNSLGQILKDSKSLVVASSDLSHFYSVDKAHRLDHIVAEDIEQFEESKLFDDIQHRQCEACGAGPIVAAMIATKLMGAKKARVLSYHTSGEVSGDYNEVVGYLSGVFYN
jgi:AmmeMemoRadiSam system protein B